MSGHYSFCHSSSVTLIYFLTSLSASDCRQEEGQSMEGTENRRSQVCSRQIQECLRLLRQELEDRQDAKG